MSSWIGPVTKVRDQKFGTISTHRDILPQANGTVITQVSHQYPVVTLADTAQTYKVPGWKSLVMQGAQAGSPYDRQVQWCTVTPGYIQAVGKGPGGSTNRVNIYETWGCDSPSAPGTVEVDGYLQANNKALTRFYAAIRAEYQHNKTLISIGELPETVRMFKRPFAGMQGIINGYLHTFDRRGRSVVAARKRRKRNKLPLWQDLNRVAAESWLEVSFGVRPLLSDVEGIAETLMRFQDNGRDRRTQVQGFADSTKLGSTSQTSSSVGSFNPTLLCQMTRTSWLVKYRGGLRSSVSGPDGSLYRLRSLAGFIPEEFVPTVWNLCPWSFLADYFFNIGQVLDATWTVTSDVRWATESHLGKTIRLVDNKVDHTAIKAQLGINYISSVGTYAWRIQSGRTRATRIILDPANLPVPMIDSKSFEDWNPMKVANILALLKTKARGISRGLLTTSRG